MPTFLVKGKLRPSPDVLLQWLKIRAVCHSVVLPALNALFINRQDADLVGHVAFTFFFGDGCTRWLRRRTITFRH